MDEFNLPIDYTKLKQWERKLVREQYIKEQNGKCMFCHNKLTENPVDGVEDVYINLSLFPINFLDNPIHLQHNHTTGMTEGAVHARCNAYLWQYEGR